MPYPVLDLPYWLGDAMLDALWLVLLFSAALAAGGSVLVLAAERRARRSVDPRWSWLARGAALGVCAFACVAAPIAGAGLLLLVAIFMPAMLEVILAAFAWPLGLSLAVCVAGLALLTAYVSRGLKNRGIVGFRFPVGLAAVACLWVAAFAPVVVRELTLTGWAGSSEASLRALFMRPDALLAYAVWGAEALLLAASLGLAWASLQREAAWRRALLHDLGWWTALAALAAAVVGAAWNASLSGEIRGTGDFAVWSAGAVGGGALLAAWAYASAVRWPGRLGRFAGPLAALGALAVVAAMGVARKEARGPFLVRGAVYRNSVVVSGLDEFRRTGLWRPAPWTPDASAPEGEALGAFSFQAQCVVCHGTWVSADAPGQGPGFRVEGEALRFLNEIGERHPQLPVFAGSETEKEDLAAYLEALVRRSGGTLAAAEEAAPPLPEKLAPPPASAVRKAEPVPPIKKPKPVPAPPAKQPVVEAPPTAGEAPAPSVPAPAEQAPKPPDEAPPAEPSAPSGGVQVPEKPKTPPAPQIEEKTAPAPGTGDVVPQAAPPESEKTPETGSSGPDGEKKPPAGKAAEDGAAAPAVEKPAEPVPEAPPTESAPAEKAAGEAVQETPVSPGGEGEHR